MAFKRRIESFTKEEQEEKYLNALKRIDGTKPFINLFTLFCEANEDVDINLSEFRDFIKNRKK